MLKGIMRIVFLSVVVSLMISSPAFSSSYFGYTDWGGTWHDAEKTHINPFDDLMCWAAAASNILDWGGWGTPTFNTEALIFKNFRNHWTDEGGLPQYGWAWWLNGTLPPLQRDWSRVNIPGAGNYWPSYNFNAYYYEQWNEGLTLSSIDSYLHSGYGVTIGIYTSGGGHALTVWGYEYDAYGNYSGLYITDSDDYKTQLAYYPVIWDDVGRWNLGGGYDGWYIGEVEVLDMRQTPEPSTILLISSGLIGILGLRKKFKN